MCDIGLIEVERIVGSISAGDLSVGDLSVGDLSAGDFEDWYDEWDTGYRTMTTGEIWERYQTTKKDEICLTRSKGTSLSR